MSLPGVEGEFGVLPGHTPFLAVLQTGRDVVPAGHREALPAGVDRLRRSAARSGDGARAGRRRRASDLDVARAEDGMKRAEEWLPVAGLEIDFERARLALLRTLQQLQVRGPEVSDNVRQPEALVRYRGLIQTLVVRDLKARYRGSVLGFFWSFFNPAASAPDLLLRLHRRSSRACIRPRWSRTRCSCSAASCRGPGSPRRCWSRLASSLSGGNLIKKVLFPAEVLPIVTVLANMVHFFLGLPILAGVPDLLSPSARSAGVAVVPGDRARAAAADDRVWRCSCRR